MNRDSSPVERKLIRCFRETFGSHLPSDVTTANVANTGNWDSMMTWTLILLVQERFEITIGLDQIPKLKDFSSLLSYVERKLKAKATSV